jgi:uncharacterized membrane protein
MHERPLCWKDLLLSSENARTVQGKRAFTVIAVAAVVLQATALSWLSILQYASFVLNVDFSLYQHAFAEIVHGNYNPDATYVGGVFFQNHGEAMMWPIAIVFRFFDPAAVLLTVQNAATVGISVLIALWIARIVDRSPEGWDPANTIIASVCAAAGILDPWFVWANAQDFHFEAPATFFVLAALYAFVRNRFLLGIGASSGCILCGDVSSTYTFGLGFFLLFLSGAARKASGVVIMVLSVAWLAMLHSFAVHRGASLPGIYAGLFPGDPHATDSALHLAVAVLTHPLAVIHALGYQLPNIYANIAPGGILGILSPSALAIGLVPFLENFLSSGRLFSQPSFQNVPLYAAVGIGTFGVIYAIRSRVSRVLALTLVALIALNDAGWCAVVMPNVKKRWIAASWSASKVISDAYYGTSHSTQIVTSQGVLGRFGQFAVSSFWVQGIALRTEPVTALFAPYEGINTLEVNADFTNLQTLARRGAQIVEHGRGVWWLRYSGSLDDPHLFLPFQSHVVEAWTIDATRSHPVLDGKQDDWHLADDGKPGYVMDHDYWRYPLGAYVGEVELVNSAPVTYEILNASNLTIIYRRTVPAGPRRTVRIPFDHAILVNETGFRGSWPFVFEPFTPPKDNALEVRIWSDGKARVNVYKVGIVPAAMRNILE